MSGPPSPIDVTGRPVRLRDVDLDHFFRPRTVAVIGASDTPLRPNTAMTTKIRAWAERAGAAIYPVNPNRDEVDGLPCARSLLDVPADIDLAIILTGEPLEGLQQAIEKKAHFAVIFAAGFAETGAAGEKLQAQLDELVKASELHLLGPNTNLNAFETFRDDLPGPRIALITQSGHQGRPIFQGQEIGIALSHWAPTGNEVDLEFADFARWFADRDEVGVIAAYVEGFKDGRTLMLAADHAAQAGVPMVVVKVGRTDEGASMAKAHTGHLTGSDAVTSAVFRQFGVTRVDGLDELLDTSALLARARAPRGDGVCVYAISGGTGAHMADMAAELGLRLPHLGDETQKQLHEWIPPYLRVSNPVDNGGAPSADWRGRKILDTILADPAVDILICPITGALPSMSKRLAKDLIDIAETTDKPVCVIWGSPVENDVAYQNILLSSSRVAVFRTFANCVRAVRAYLDYYDFQSRYTSPFDKPVLRPLPAATRAREILGAGGNTLSELASKEVLRAYGIKVSQDILTTSATEAARAASKIGFPVVMKVASPDILHKSDLGLVKGGLSTPKAARDAYGELSARARAAKPKASIDGVLVCQQITGGVETVIGVAQDQLFGPTVMFGLGGIFIEVLQDVTFRVPPFGKDEALRMTREVKGSALLDGVRGQPRVNRNALVDTIMRVQRLAVDLSSEIDELDINPLIVRPGSLGATALDALIVTR
jgi:acyl-CoA synthetase (NDP forming)